MEMVNMKMKNTLKKIIVILGIMGISAVSFSATPKKPQPKQKTNVVQPKRKTINKKPTKKQTTNPQVKKNNTKKRQKIKFYVIKF